MKTKLILSSLTFLAVASIAAAQQVELASTNTVVQGEVNGVFNYKPLSCKKLNKGGAWFKKGESLEETFEEPLFIRNIVITAKEGFWTNSTIDVFVDGRKMTAVNVNDGAPVYSVEVNRPAQQVLFAFHGRTQVVSINYYVREMWGAVGVGSCGQPSGDCDGKIVGGIIGGIRSGNPVVLGQVALKTVMQLEKMSLAPLPELHTVKVEALKLAAKAPQSALSQDTRAQALALQNAIEAADGFIQQVANSASSQAVVLAEHLIAVKEKIKEMLSK